VLAHVSAALLALGPVPTVDVALVDPAPTGVTIRWATPAHEQVLVTWQETGDLRNVVQVVDADGSPMGIAGVVVEAGQPNETLLFGGGFDQDRRIAVWAVDADDTPTSDPGLSPVYDTDRPPAPVIHTVAPREDGTILLQWRPGHVADDTPGDPLDLPAEVPQRFIPVASHTGFNAYDELSGPTTATSIVVVDRPKPVQVGVRTVPNEWGSSGAAAQVWGTRLTATVPRTAVDGGRLRVTGTAIKVGRSCDPGPCTTEDWPDAGRTLHLQSRTSADAAWTVVATGRADAQGDFGFTVVSPGTRDYRVFAPVVTLGADREPEAFAATQPVTTRSVAGGGTGGAGGGPEGPTLPITGAPGGTAAGLGAVLVALGVLLRIAARRRETVAPPS
jgi:hypothetical protein